jgi:hypothetical protein
METALKRVPRNKGKLVAQKAPRKANEILAIRLDLQHRHDLRQLAMFNIAFDSKLRGCDLVSLRVGDVCHRGLVIRRASVVRRSRLTLPYLSGRPDRYPSRPELPAAVGQPIRIEWKCLASACEPLRAGSSPCWHWI